ENDTLEFDVGGVPVYRVAHDNYPVVGLMRFQLEWPAGDDAAGIGPGVAELFDRLLINCAEELMRHQADEKRSRLGQTDAESVIIDRLNADVLGFDGHKLFACDGSF